MPIDLNLVFSYVQTLNSYLDDFLRRTHPLEMGTVDAALKPVEEGFEKEWKEGKVEGWQRKAAASAQTNGDVAEAEEGIWCAACEFKGLGSRSTRVYGYLDRSGQKQYAKKTVYDAHLTSKKHIKAAERLAADGGAATPEPTAKANASSTAHHAITSKAHAAALLTRLTETLLLLPPVPALINDTKQNIERKSALTAREREQEVEEAMEETNVVAEEAPEEEDDGRIYNPLKLPLGWDGKPVPYWLYKLHGLGVEYKCEICSDYVYMGRSVFANRLSIGPLAHSVFRLTGKLSIVISRNQDTPLACELSDCQTRSIFMKSPKSPMLLPVSNLAFH